MENNYPIKTCEYCREKSEAYTLISGETICHKCLMSIPTEPRLLKKEIVELRKQVADWHKLADERSAEILRLQERVESLERAQEIRHKTLIHVNSKSDEEVYVRGLEKRISELANKYLIAMNRITELESKLKDCQNNK